MEQKLLVQIQPGAKKNEIVGWIKNEFDQDVLKVRIAAPPVEGKANEELVRFLKKVLKPFGVRQVALSKGHQSKYKVLILEMNSEDSVRNFKAQMNS